MGALQVKKCSKLWVHVVLRCHVLRLAAGFVPGNLPELAEFAAIRFLQLFESRFELVYADEERCG